MDASRLVQLIQKASGPTRNQANQSMQDVIGARGCQATRKLTQPNKPKDPPNLPNQPNQPTTCAVQFMPIISLGPRRNLHKEIIYQPLTHIWVHGNKKCSDSLNIKHLWRRPQNPHRLLAPPPPQKKRKTNPRSRDGNVIELLDGHELPEMPNSRSSTCRSTSEMGMNVK